MYKKILIANRGEIALRIIRACRELQIKTVSVYSTVDDLSLHAKFADETVCIGPADSKNSYLNIPSIIAAAELTNADAIHPGYGFLAENANFSKICSEHNLSFIGPEASIISAMGNKSSAIKSMKLAGVPVVPGSDGPIESYEKAKLIAKEIGYPVLIKASSGGGGRGMRLVENEEQLENAFQTAQSEAQAFFNDNQVYIEKYILQPRHIEVQVLADGDNVFAIGERECTIQRRHQKIIEESPSNFIDDNLRKQLFLSAIKAAQAVNYIGAGTVEFLVDVENHYYFIEMNTRIQVEHPVTEMVTNIDLIKFQILCHYGVPLPKWMGEIKTRGHAIECRINAEDPNNKFIPSPGIISSFYMPGGMGVRVDTHVYTGYKVPSNYDSMIAKLIVHAPTRKEAIKRMSGALDECVVEGIKTIIPLHKKIMADENYIKGNFDTSFLDKIIN